MKLPYITLLALMMVGCVSTKPIADGLPVKHARVCERFKQMKWLDREKEGQAVAQVLRQQALVAKADGRRRLQRKQIVELLGEPDYRTPNGFEYFLSRRGSKDNILVIELQHGRAVEVSTVVVTH
jgi:hypothetical protein